MAENDFIGAKTEGEEGSFPTVTAEVRARNAAAWGNYADLPGGDRADRERTERLVAEMNAARALAAAREDETREERAARRAAEAETL